MARLIIEIEDGHGDTAENCKEFIEAAYQWANVGGLYGNVSETGEIRLEKISHPGDDIISITVEELKWERRS